MSTRSLAPSATPADVTGDRGPWPLPARLGAAGVLLFLGASVVTGALSPGYQWQRESISALAATDKAAAPVMIAGFLAAAVGLTATGIGLWRRFRGTASGRVAAVLVTVCGLTLTVSGLARQDCSDRLTTCRDYGAAPLASTHYWVHQYVSLALFLLMTVALFVLARATRRVQGWSRLTVATRLAGLWAVLVIADLMVDPPALNGWAGAIQRAFIVVLFGWPVLVAGLPARPAE